MFFYEIRIQTTILVRLKSIIILLVANGIKTVFRYMLLAWLVILSSSTCLSSDRDWTLNLANDRKILRRDTVALWKFRSDPPADSFAICENEPAFSCARLSCPVKRLCKSSSSLIQVTLKLFIRLKYPFYSISCLESCGLYDFQEFTISKFLLSLVESLDFVS